ncbi:MAG: hypothetical protein EPN26_13640 [Rhodospirillales bacterium]|nr:MAG: hypothetical protein EPN26_13640 [Rhodospirillales bacterium]
MKDGQSRFALVGNKPCLDFANTVHARGCDIDAMPALDDLFDFLIDAKILPAGEITLARHEAGLSPDEAGAMFDSARRLRGLLRKWLGGIETHAPVAHELVGEINAILSSFRTADKLIACDGVWHLEHLPEQRRMIHLLIPIARSAAELIAEGPGLPVRKCGNPRCPLYFYDTSRNKLRRWCKMSSCGNLHKVKAHLARRIKG